MGDTLTRFYQGAVAASGTSITPVVPTNTTYTVRNIVLTNNAGGGTIAASVYVNTINNNNAIIPSGSLIVPAGYLQTTDFFVLAAGEKLVGVLASGTTGLTASVHGIITT